MSGGGLQGEKGRLTCSKFKRREQLFPFAFAAVIQYTDITIQKFVEEWTMDNRFLFGAVYIIEQEYTDETVWRDLRNMKDCGFNLITLWPIANPWLTKSSREWVFERTRFVLDCCETLGLKAILQLFGQNQAQEFMPDSVCLPEMECVDERGGTLDQGSNCFWANLNHPTVREYMDKYFKEAICTLKDHPAVYGWDVFNEAHFRSDDPWTKAHYREWLKGKYGTIENLNNRWYRRYDSFSQIRPDKRRAPYSIWSSLLPSVEYEKFRSVTLTEICRFLYETAQKYDTEHPIMIDGTSTQIVGDDVTQRNNDEFETAYIPDIYGATFYPKSWGRNYRETPWTLSMYYTIPAAAAKMAGKPYFVNELQTHTQSVLTPGSEVTAEELTAWTLMCMFTGAKAMQLWRWRPFLHGYQATGRGLTRMDGTPNERAAAMKELLDVNSERDMLIGEDKLPTGFQYQLLQLLDEDAKVIAVMEDGSPAIVEHRYGKGKTVYFNNFEGLVLLEKLYPELQKAIREAVEPLRDRCVCKSDRVHLACMESKGRRMILAVNFSDSEQTVRFEGTAPSTGLRELFTESSVMLSERRELTLPANSHRIFVYRKTENY